MACLIVYDDEGIPLPYGQGGNPNRHNDQVISK